MRSFLTTAVALLAVGVNLAGAATSWDGTCGKNGGIRGIIGADGYTCPKSKPCCSSSGKCGSGDSFCLISNGCQSAFGNCTAPVTDTVSTDLTCGITGAGTQGYICPDTAGCCSAA